MVRRGRHILVLGVVGLAFVACLFPSLEQLGTSFGKGDAGTSTDGAVLDGPIPSDAAPAKFCDPYRDADLCVDFSEPTALGAPFWTFLDAPSDAGSMTLSFDASPTPPSVALEVPNSGSCQYMRLIRRFANTPRIVSAQVKVFIPDSTNGSVLRLHAEDGAGANDTPCQYALQVENDKRVGLFVRRGDNNGDLAEAGLPVEKAYRSWQTISLKLDYEVGRAFISWGDTENATSVPIPAYCKPQPVVSVVFGVHCSPIPRSRMFDDVLVEIRR